MKAIETLLELQDLQLGPTAGTPETARKIEALRRSVPETVLGHYERLTARGKKGIAVVRNGVCGGCRMLLASGLRATLLRDDDLCICDSCARYLVMAPPDPVPTEVVAPKVVRRGRPRRNRGEPAAEPSAPPATLAELARV